MEATAFFCSLRGTFGQSACVLSVLCGPLKIGLGIFFQVRALHRTRVSSPLAGSRWVGWVECEVRFQDGATGGCEGQAVDIGTNPKYEYHRQD